MELNTRISIPTGADLDTYTTPGSYVSGNSLITQSLLHKPQNVNSGAYLDVCKLHANGAFTQIMRQWGDGVYSVRSINRQTGLISEWVPYAPSTPPQEYALPLVEGTTNLSIQTSKYYKDQFGQVTVHIMVHSNTTFGNPSKIAILPAGFRPINNILVPAVDYETGSCGYISLGTDGSISVDFGNSDASNAIAIVFFCTAN